MSDFGLGLTNTTLKYIMNLLWEKKEHIASSSIFFPYTSLATNDIIARVVSVVKDSSLSVSFNIEFNPSIRNASYLNGLTLRDNGNP